MDFELGLDPERILERALSRGCSMAEVRVQRRDTELIEIDNRELENFSSHSSTGVGIRIEYNGGRGFASTTDISEGGLGEALSNAIKAAGSIPRGEVSPLSKVERGKADLSRSYKRNPFDISSEEKVSLALDTNKAGWNNPQVKSVRTRLGLVMDYKHIISTEGVDLKLETPLVGLGQASVAVSEKGRGSSRIVIPVARVTSS
jgi:predicted Zn-dependent protease